MDHFSTNLSHFFSQANLISVCLLFLSLQTLRPTMPFFIFFFLLSLTNTPTQAHNRRILHQPFFPLDSFPPAEPPSSSPEPKFPSSTNTPPFFPSYPAPPPPPPATSLATFPANISSLVFPQHSTPRKSSKKLIVSVLLPVIFVSLFAVFVFFFFSRRRTYHDKTSRSDSHRLFPANNPSSDGHKVNVSGTSSEFLYLGTLVNSRPLDENADPGVATVSSPYRKLGSPELQPLPPLVRQFRRNAEPGESEDEEFYSPRGSSGGKESPATGSSRRVFPVAAPEKIGNGSTNSSTPSYPSSNSASPTHSTARPSNSPSPLSNITSANMRSNGISADSNSNSRTPSSSKSPSPVGLSPERTKIVMASNSASSSPLQPVELSYGRPKIGSPNFQSNGIAASPYSASSSPSASFDLSPERPKIEPPYLRSNGSATGSNAASGSPSSPFGLSPERPRVKPPNFGINFLRPPPPPPPPPRPMTPSPPKRKPPSPSPPSPTEKESERKQGLMDDVQIRQSVATIGSFTRNPFASTPPPPPPPPDGFGEASVGQTVTNQPFSRPPVLATPARSVDFSSQAAVSTENFAENADGLEKTEDTPRPKLKPLHWDKVRASSDRAMVWDQLKSSSFQLNEEMIETLFVCNNKNTTPKDTARRQILPSPNQENRVLDPKKSQNIAILLRALNVTKEEVCEALLEGNTDSLGSELLETLLKMAPTREEELKLKEYKDDSPVKLGPAERFLKAVLDVPFAFRRVDVMLYIANFDSEVKYLRKSFETLEAACEELRNSRMFLKLLEAVLKTGNRMNVGTNRGDARAFKLDTLLKLVDVKGTDGKTTLLHFVVQEIIRSEGSRLSGGNNNLGIGKTQQTSLQDDVEFRKRGLQVVAGLSGELTNVKKAAAMDSDVLSTYVSKLAGEIGKISEVLRLNNSVSMQESRQQFSVAMNEFLKKAEEEIIRIQAQESVALSLVKEITEYFHGNSAKEEPHPFRIFMVVRDFLSILDQVCKEVGKINERTIVSSARQFPVPVNPTLPVFPRFHMRQPDSSDDDDSSSSS